MKLLVDIGNTSAKLAVMGTDIVHFERIDNRTSCGSGRPESWKETFARLRTAYRIDDVRLSTVAGEDAELQEALASITVPVKWLTAQTPCPVKPIRGIPSTYGADRWAADIGAIVQDPDHTLLIIDAGTCITYDLISADGTLLGGVISPGVQLRLNAMHEHTALLPQIEATDEASLLGTDTRSHMLSAAINGTRFEMEGYIRTIHEAHPDLHVFITGGNTFQLFSDVASPLMAETNGTTQKVPHELITHDPHLVFHGLAALT